MLFKALEIGAEFRDPDSFDDDAYTLRKVGKHHALLVRFNVTLRYYGDYEVIPIKEGK